MAKQDEWDDDIPRQASAKWSEASDQEKEHALRDATSFIDKTFVFKGKPKAGLQSLSWPRIDAFYDDGKPIIGVPEPVKKATALLAGMMVAGIPMTPASLGHLYLILSPVIVEETRH